MPPRYNSTAMIRKLKGGTGELDPVQRDKYRSNYDTIFRKGTDAATTTTQVQDRGEDKDDR